jgi:manganese/zinc/iron transport system substrate-binding protein
MMGLALLLAGGCARVDGTEDGRIPVVATTGMVADLVAQVGGERVRVVGLMGPGVDPHLYKARAGDVRRISRARIIFYNGLHLEAAMGEVLEEMGGRVPTVAIAGGIDRAMLLSPPEHAGAYDPHIWLDVGLWRSGVGEVEAALVRLDPEGAAFYRANAERYRVRLAELDGWVRARVAEVPAERRVLITSHDAFNYFGRAYGFEVRGLQGISTATEAGTGDVQRLADFIIRRGVPAIFVETSVPRRTVEAVRAAVRSRGGAVEIGGELYSDALGTPGTPAATYTGMVEHNVETIVASLLGRTPALAAGAER